MDIVVPAFAITLIVMFVFYLFAQSLRRTVKRQSWTIRQLFERVRNLESIADPLFLQRLNEAAPMPLEQVFTLSFRIDDRFWREALHVSDDVRKFVRDSGSFVGSVKLERWRSHTVATITEVLPDKKSIGWQSRTLDLYTDPTRGSEAHTLWELPLARPGLSAEQPPSLELALRGNSIELCGHLTTEVEKPSSNGNAAAHKWDDVVFFRVPLDAAQLAGFRSHDPMSSVGNGNGNSGVQEMSGGPNSWQAFYSDRNEALGIEWQLWLRDLTKRSEWERWKILESNGPPLVTEKR